MVALPTNVNTSQHTIALVLMHNQARFNNSRLLVGVRCNTTDERRINGIQSLHQIIKLALVEGSYSLATTILLNFSWLTRVIIEVIYTKRIAAILDSIVQYWYVLLRESLFFSKPSSQVARDSSGIMNNSKMCTRIRLRAGLLKVWTFAQQVLMKLGSKGLISSLGEEMGSRPIGFSNMAMQACKPMPMSTSAHSIPFLTYSSCLTETCVS